MAARAVTALDALPLSARDDRFDPSAPSLTVTSMRVDGEPAINTIPDAVWLSIDRRLLPGETPQAALTQIESAIRDVVRPPFSSELVVNRVCPPYIAAEGDVLVSTIQQIVRRVGRAGTLGTDPAADDSSWLGNAGISTVLCGPGRARAGTHHRRAGRRRADPRCDLDLRTGHPRGPRVTAVRRTHSRNTTTPSTTSSKRRDRNRSKACCAPGRRK